MQNGIRWILSLPHKHGSQVTKSLKSSLLRQKCRCSRRTPFTLPIEILQDDNAGSNSRLFTRIRVIGREVDGDSFGLSRCCRCADFLYKVLSVGRAGAGNLDVFDPDAVSSSIGLLAGLDTELWDEGGVEGAVLSLVLAISVVSVVVTIIAIAGAVVGTVIAIATIIAVVVAIVFPIPVVAVIFPISIIVTGSRGVLSGLVVCSSGWCILITRLSSIALAIWSSGSWGLCVRRPRTDGLRRLGRLGSIVLVVLTVRSPYTRLAICNGPLRECSGEPCKSADNY